jgi:hypothetical protein
VRSTHPSVEAFCSAIAGDHRIVADDASGRVQFLSLELTEGN